jgi:pimeloyl-ACP methyl ester carboxylesterase
MRDRSMRHDSIRGRRRTLLAASLMGAGFFAASFSAPPAAAAPGSGAKPWQSLPPTPALPAGTVGRHAEIQGARIWYAEWGAAAADAPVLLLHGGFGNSNYFGDLIPALVAHRYRVIAIDSRGHGRSTRGDAPLSYHLMAQDVIGLLDALKVPKVYLVGWSDGGITGLDLAMNHPERLAGLFAFGANADLSGLTGAPDKTPVFGAYLERTAHEYRTLSPNPQDWEGFSAAVNKMWETLPAFTRSELASIKVPTTIADGEFDEAIKQTHDEYMAQAIPGARLVILPDVSHFAMLQDPRAFNAAVLRFLKGGPPPAAFLHDATRLID